MPAKIIGSVPDQTSPQDASVSEAGIPQELNMDALTQRGADAYEQGLAAIVQALPYMAFIVDDQARLIAANADARDVLAGPDQDIPQSALTACAAITCPTVLNLDVTGGLVHAFQISPLQVPAPNGRRYLLATQTLFDGLPLIGDRFFASGYDAPQAHARDLREEAARFKRLSETDPLTGALNVRAFAALVRRALKDRPWRQGVLLFLDLDRFKEINDAYGHDAGDQVLIHVAQRLRFPPHTWIATARVGGDEFALWLPGVCRSSLTDVIASLQARLARPALVDTARAGRAEITVTASIGAACCPEEAQTYEKLKSLADHRMYEDKAQQDGRV